MSTVFDNYKFHCSQLGSIMAGVPKPLTDNQEEYLKKLQNIHAGNVYAITEKQLELLDEYAQRRKGDGKPLTDNQEQTFLDLLDKKVNPVKLSEKQIIDYGDLISKKNAKCQLTDGVKKYLEQCVWEYLSGRTKRLQTKFFDKGNDVEEKSLTAYSNQKESLTLKNQETKENDWLIGTADIARYKIRDIKSSWNWHTFPLTKDSIPSEGYKWQLDGYMDLWGLTRAELIYCLVDTPFKLIDDELRRLDWRYNIMTQDGEFRDDPEIIDLVVEVISGFIYTFKGLEDYCHQSTSLQLDWFVGKFKEVPEEIRVKIFKHNKDEQRIEYMKEMITLAREYMNGVVDEIGENAYILLERELVEIESRDGQKSYHNIS